jgi:hypothetical protein
LKRTGFIAETAASDFRQEEIFSFLPQFRHSGSRGSAIEGIMALIGMVSLYFPVFPGRV